MKEIPEEKKADVYVDFAEIQPSPEGGLTAFYSYLSKNIRYPKTARKVGIQGNVFVRFIVDKEGNLTNLEVVKEIGVGCDEEAIRVLKKAPRRNPGSQGGRKVNVQMIIRMHFRLN